MIGIKLFLVAVLFITSALSLDDNSQRETPRTKKDVLLGTLPYAYAAAAIPQAYSYTVAEDYKYIPKAYALSAPAVAAPAAYHVAALPAVPAISSYASFPAYTYGYSPYYKSYVY